MKKLFLFGSILLIYFTTKNIINYPKLLDFITLISVALMILIILSVPLLFSIASLTMFLCGKWEPWVLFARKYISGNSKMNLFSSFKRNPATGLLMRKNSSSDIGGNTRGTINRY